MECDSRNQRDGITATQYRWRLYQEFFVVYPEGKERIPIRWDNKQIIDQRRNPHWHSRWVSPLNNPFLPVSHFSQTLTTPLQQKLNTKSVLNSHTAKLPRFLVPLPLKYLGIFREMSLYNSGSTVHTKELKNVTMALVCEKEGEQSRQTSKLICLFMQ